MCPYCRLKDRTKKRGFFTRKSTNCSKVQRYFCHRCQKYFCDRTLKADYRERKAYLNQKIARLISVGVSQKSCAFILHVQPRTIARKVKRLGLAANAANFRFGTPDGG